MWREAARDAYLPILLNQEPGYKQQYRNAMEGLTGSAPLNTTGSSLQFPDLVIEVPLDNIEGEVWKGDQREFDFVRGMLEVEEYRDETFEENAYEHLARRRERPNFDNDEAMVDLWISSKEGGRGRRFGAKVFREKLWRRWISYMN